MPNEIARILAYGDLHLSSKNYGAHFNYPEDSLNVLRRITEEATSFNATHIIGLGDFSFGRFSSLEYRYAVETELQKQYTQTKGKRYELQGNHDKAGYGMTEFEYYITKGLLKQATGLDIGNVHITMLNYGDINKIKPNIVLGDEHTNIIFMHDYVKFNDTKLPNFGDALILDNFEPWFGVDYIIGGHIHTSYIFDGLIMKSDSNGQTLGHRAMVDYIGCMARPAYIKDITDTVGHLLKITIYDNNEIKYDRLDIELPSIESTFNLKLKEKEVIKKTQKENRVSIADVIQQLNEHKQIIGSPEVIIQSMTGIDERYKQKAIDLLKLGES